MSRQYWLMTAAAALMLAGPTMKAGPSTDTLYPAVVTFSDRQSDAITSDYLTSGNHSYTDGGKSFECGFHTVTGDLVMRSLTGPRGTDRYLAFSFAPITPAGAPAGSLQQHDLFMVIHTILTMATGTAKSTAAAFSTAVGFFKLTPAWVDTNTYATDVFVSRSGNTWTVTADPGVPPGPGDVAGLTQTKGNKETLVGLYHMPFQITVTCPNCP